MEVGLRADGGKSRRSNHPAATHVLSSGSRIPAATTTAWWIAIGGGAEAVAPAHTSGCSRLKSRDKDRILKDLESRTRARARLAPLNADSPARLNTSARSSGPVYTFSARQDIAIETTPRAARQPWCRDTLRATRPGDVLLWSLSENLPGVFRSGRHLSFSAR